MNQSKHAKVRARQRGFSTTSLDIILEFGREEQAPGNSTRIFMGKRECQRAITEFKRMIQLLDKAKGGTIIVADDDSIITMYKTSEK